MFMLAALERNCRAICFHFPPFVFSSFTGPFIFPLENDCKRLENAATSSPLQPCVRSKRNLQALLTRSCHVCYLCVTFRDKYTYKYAAFRTKQAIINRKSTAHRYNVSNTGWWCSEACWKPVFSVSVFSSSEDQVFKSAETLQLSYTRWCYSEACWKPRFQSSRRPKIRFQIIRNLTAQLYWVMLLRGLLRASALG